MKVKLINPRGRVVEVDDEQLILTELLRNGFSYAPEGAEVGKDYNPVFDRGKKLLPKPVKDTRQDHPSVSGDLLKVIKL